MPQNPKQSIAGTGEWVDDHELVPRHTFGNRSNIETNVIAECVTGTLYRCTAENTNAAAVPFFRSHSVNADVVGIREAIDSVLLNFRESQYFIALAAVK